MNDWFARLVRAWPETYTAISISISVAVAIPVPILTSAPLRMVLAVM